MNHASARLGLAEGPETDRIRAFLEEARAHSTSGSVRAPAAEVTIAVGDDAAAFRPPAGEELVISSDASVEGIHFRREWMTWETIGYRAVASALSDLAAMAATPIGLLLSAALPPELGVEIASALGRGVGEAAGTAGAVLLGGDLVASPGPVFLDVTVLGHATDPVSRNGAREGDELWVTGTLGGAAAAVRDLTNRLEPEPAARAALERPRPRIDEARWLVGRGDVHAAIDISDGLIRDARHLATASRVAVEIDVPLVPMLPALDRFRDTPAGARLLLSGGEDYEILIAAAPGSLRGASTAFETRFGVSLTRIGRITSGEGVRTIGLGELDAGAGFDHFRTDR